MDLHSFFADPDPANSLNADPDPAAKKCESGSPTNFKKQPYEEFSVIVKDKKECSKARNNEDSANLLLKFE